tara:strand:- start:1521 stop:1685 length:165 start_codon:yes stop_codon:yes gene_type:complete
MVYQEVLPEVYRHARRFAESIVKTFTDAELIDRTKFGKKPRKATHSDLVRRSVA